MADDLDLEEELLQVAGRSRAPAAKKRGRGKRAADSDDASSEEASSEDEGRGRGKKKQSQGSKRQKGGKGVSEDEEEDDVDEDGYGSDLYGDDEDREKLEAMTELEREMLLADRAEERDRIRQRREILKKARDADKAEPRGQRLSSRQKKSTSDKDSAIRKIEAARKRQDKGSKASKAKGKKSYDDDDGSEDGEEEYVESDAEGSEEEEGAVGSEEEEEEERPARKPTTRATAEAAERDDAGRDRDQAGRRHDEGDAEDHLRGVRRQAYDAEDDMDVDEGRGGGHAEGHMDDDENADPNELRAIQLTRTQLEAMCDKPFFEGEGLTGALVRMAYGAATVNKDGRSVPTYWMMQIVSIKEGSTSYPFGPRQAPCFKRLELRDGARTVRVMPMSNASNQPLEDGECERFARHAGRVQDRPISKQQAADIKQKIQNAINYRWDSVKVKEMLARKREGGALPVNITAEKSRVQRLLEGEQGKAVVDVDKVAELELRLKELDEQLKKVAGEKRSGMSNINQRNKDANFSQTIRNVSNRPANSIGRKAGTSDPFSRRETRPNIYWNTTAKKDADAGAEGKASAAAAIKLASAASMDVPLKASMARLDPTELVKMLDFDIDTKPLQDCSIVPPLHMRLLGPRWHQSLAHHVNLDLSGRTLLTVQDWQQRTGG